MSTLRKEIISVINQAIDVPDMDVYNIDISFDMGVYVRLDRDRGI